MDQLNYHRNHQPRCLAGFQLRSVRSPDIAFDGHGEPLNTFFAVDCPCGSSRHFVLGHYWRNPDFHNVLVFLSPLAVRCESCGRVAELIDTDIHGYDGEMDGSCTMCGEGERQDFRCIECGPQPFQVTARFEYTDDLFTDEFGDYRGRESDLFTWFSLVGVCGKCGRIREIADFECA